MPIINTVVNEATDEEITFAKGTVKRILFKDSSPAQKKYDTNYVGTIIVSGDAGEDDVFVTIGLKKQEDRIAYAEGKKGSETWHELQVGDEVKLSLKVSGNDPARPFYSTTATRIKVIKRAEGGSNQGNKSSAPTKGQEKKAYTPRDTTGMEVGHAVNGGFELVRAGASLSPVEAAKVVHNATTTLKAKEAKRRGVELTNYDVGASVGHAILNACKNSAGKITSEEDLIAEAQNVLEVSEEITAYVKNGNTSNTTTAKEEKKQEVKKPVEKEIEFVPDDMDDLPF